MNPLRHTKLLDELYTEVSYVSKSIDKFRWQIHHDTCDGIKCSPEKKKEFDDLFSEYDHLVRMIDAEEAFQFEMFNKPPRKLLHD